MIIWEKQYIDHNETKEVEQNSVFVNIQHSVKIEKQQVIKLDFKRKSKWTYGIVVYKLK